MLIYDIQKHELILEDMDNEVCRIMPYAPEGFKYCRVLGESYPECGYDFFMNSEGNVVAVPETQRLYAAKKGEN